MPANLLWVIAVVIAIIGVIVLISGSVLWGIILLGEHPDRWSILGAAIIIGGTLLVSLSRRPAAGGPAAEPVPVPESSPG